MNSFGPIQTKKKRKAKILNVYSKDARILFAQCNQSKWKNYNSKFFFDSIFTCQKRRETKKAATIFKCM